MASKIRRLGRRSVVSRRKHKSGKIQLLLLTDSDSDGDSDNDVVSDRRISHHSTAAAVLNDDHDVQNPKSTSENVEDYEHGLETSSLDHGFLALFANRHESSKVGGK